MLLLSALSFTSCIGQKYEGKMTSEKKTPPIRYCAIRKKASAGFPHLKKPHRSKICKQKNQSKSSILRILSVLPAGVSNHNCGSSNSNTATFSKSNTEWAGFCLIGVTTAAGSANRQAQKFMRELREMVFMKKKNIAKWKHIEQAAVQVGLDAGQLKKDIEGQGKLLFQEDLKLAREMGVRGFPTLFFVNESGEKEVVYGSKPYPFYETAVLKLNLDAKKSEYEKTPAFLFSKFDSLRLKEFSELSGIPEKPSEIALSGLEKEGKLIRFSGKNGSVWQLKN